SRRTGADAVRYSRLLDVHCPRDEILAEGRLVLAVDELLRTNQRARTRRHKVGVRALRVAHCRRLSRVLSVVGGLGATIKLDPGFNNDRVPSALSRLQAGLQDETKVDRDLLARQHAGARGPDE